MTLTGRPLKHVYRNWPILSKLGADGRVSREFCTLLVVYVYQSICVSRGCGFLRYDEGGTTYSSRLSFASLGALETEGKRYCMTVSNAKIYKGGQLDGLREPQFRRQMAEESCIIK